MALADAANGVQPSDESLTLARGSTAGLSGPGALVNEVNGDAAKLFTKLFAFGLERFKGNAGAAIELIVELAPSPGSRWIAGRLTAAMGAGAIANGGGPGGRSAFELGEQGATEIEIGLTALEFQEAFVGVAVVIGILVLHGAEEPGNDFRGFGQARSKLETVFEVADFLFELEQLQLLVAGVQDGKERLIDGFADAQQFAIGANNGRLFGKKLFPAKTEILELLLQREPGVLMPAEAILDGITKLHERFFDFFAHFAGRRRAEGGHLAVPAAGEVLAQVHEARKLAQGLKMFGEARASVFYFCRFDELAPSLVREERERAKLSAILEMDEDFAREAFLILERMLMRKLWAEFEERFLGGGGFAVNAADKADQLVPGLAVCVAIFAGVNGGKLPLFFSGKRIDSLGQVGGERFQLIGRALGRAGLPEIGTQIEFFHTEAIALADGGFEVFGPRKIVELGEMTGKFGFVFARDGDVGAIKVSQLTGRKRQRSHGSDGARDPTESVLFLGDFASGVGRSPGFSGDDDVAILVGAGVGELVSDVGELFQQVGALGFQFLPFDFEGTGVGPR